jgi:hypothetical protein
MPRQPPVPDVVLMGGDDQYENFHEDLVPPFRIYLCETILSFLAAVAAGREPASAA